MVSSSSPSRFAASAGRPTNDISAQAPITPGSLRDLTFFDALASHGVEVIEVFPTASWTRWHGKRGSQSRAAWTRQGLAALGLEGVPERTNQDQRDAIAAAMTAHQHSQGLTEAIGDIVVPACR